MNDSPDRAAFPTAQDHDGSSLATHFAVSLDRRFALLAIVEWLAAIGSAAWISPLAWEGTSHHWNPNLWFSLGLGGLVCAVPVALALANRRLAVTPHINAACQMLMAGLMVHVTGGRIETHFAYFGLLAFLSFYRDWRVLATATVIAALDHLLRAALWPHSMYGTSVVSLWRPLEHAGWVLFEVALLSDFIRRADQEAGRFAAQARERNQQLEKSEKRYRAIFERAPLPMWLCDAQTLRFLAVNEETSRLYGYSEGEFLRMRAFDIRPAEEIPAFKEYAATMKEGVTRIRE